MSIVPLWLKRGFIGGRPFSPASLFTTGAPGAFYDPGDFSTLFQDEFGATPVTAVEQPVGLMLDKSRGLVRNQFSANDNFASGSTGWNAQSGWTISTGSASVNSSVAGTTLLRTTTASTVGRWYAVTVVVSSFTSGQLRAVAGTASVGSITSPGTFTLYVVANNAAGVGVQASSTNTVATITSLTVQEIPGAHASQSTSAARPTLRARYNLLTRTEEFNDAAWTKTNSGTAPAITVTANAGVAPDGTTTADRVQLSLSGGTTTSDRAVVLQSVTLLGGATYTVSFWLRSRGASVSMGIGADGIVGNQPITVTSTWQRFSFTQAAGGGGSGSVWFQLRGGQSPAHSDSADLEVWGASLLTAADQTATGGAYQRVGAATDYATGGVFRPYLAFDGTDDSMSTASVDFSGTDEMSVFAGVTKLSDATRGMLVELSASYGNPGTFGIEPPTTPATADYGFISGGSVPAGGYAIASGFAAPITSVLTAIGDISADVASLRMNGVAAATNTGNQGTGNYVNAPLFIGSRNNASVRFNGRLYSLIVLGRTATAAEIAATEAWVNSRTGAY